MRYNWPYTNNTTTSLNSVKIGLFVEGRQATGRRLLCLKALVCRHLENCIMFPYHLGRRRTKGKAVLERPLPKHLVLGMVRIAEQSRLWLELISVASTVDPGQRLQ